MYPVHAHAPAPTHVTQNHVHSSNATQYRAVGAHFSFRKKNMSGAGAAPMDQGKDAGAEAGQFEPYEGTPGKVTIDTMPNFVDLALCERT